MNSRPVLALTMGDPAGIGPEICVRALREPSVLEQCVPVLFGDVAVLRRLNSSEQIDGLSILSNEDFCRNPAVSMPTIVDCGAIDAATVVPGVIRPECGMIPNE